MANLTYITEEGMREVIQTEAARAKAEGKSYIENSTGFGNHLTGTKKKARDIGETVLSKNPGLGYCLDLNVVEAAGGVHDIGKFQCTDAYHEIEGAYMVMTRGEEWGLVRGGTQAERRQALIRIASCLPGDAALVEELGDDFPRTAAYPEFATEQIVREYEFLLKELGLSKTAFPQPFTLEAKIACFADFTDATGDTTAVRERIQGLYDTYPQRAQEARQQGDSKKANMILHRIELIKIAEPRILESCRVVEQLLK